MKVSIITPVFNNKKTIKDTIDSVLNQSYKNIEYIIVDGASKDGTLDIIKSYKNKITKVISQKDNGIYDAMNKGIKASSGEIIAIINSDDMYYDKNVISKIAGAFKNKNVNIVYSDIVYVDKNNTDKIRRYWKASGYEKGAFAKGFHPAHPSFFVRKIIYDTFGLFDPAFGISADFELMLRFMDRYNVNSYYLPGITVKMRNGGKSGKNFFNRFVGNINCYKAFKKNRIKVSFLYVFKRIFPKIRQYFKKDV